MFQLASRFSGLVVEHRHSDGSWGQLEQAHLDAADHDPEREWGNHALFVCTTCDEEVRLGLPADTVTPGPAG